jgi:hypothetical protein
MYKTIEDEVLKKAAPAALKAEFIQHEFERLHKFCLLIYVASIVIWVLLNPFYDTDFHVFELRGMMTVCYAGFLCTMTVYSFLKLREAKLYNFIMSRLLLDQALVKADEALYESKHSGEDRYTFHQ